MFTKIKNYILTQKKRKEKKNGWFLNCFMLNLNRNNIRASIYQYLFGQNKYSEC